MTAPVTIQIDGVSYPTTQQDNLTIQTVLGKTIGTLNGTIFDKSASMMPLEGADLVVTDQYGNKIFGGLSSVITGRTEGLSCYWDIQGQSYNALLSKLIFFASYQPGYSDYQILYDLFNNKVVGQNGTTGNASEFIVSPTYVKVGSNAMSSLFFNYSYAQEALELLSGYVGFNYYIDADKNLHYYYKETDPAPFDLSSSPNGTTTLPYRKLSWKRDATRIANNYVVFGAALYSDPQEDYVAGDGAKKTLSVAFKGSAIPLYACPGQNRIQVWKNTGTDIAPVWTSQTVGLFNSTDPATVDCLYDPSAIVLIFATPPPNLAHAVKVRYTFPFGAGLPSSDQGSITKYGRILSSKLIASDINSAASMLVNINNLKAQFAYALEILTCKISDADFPAGNSNRFKVGQWVNLTNDILRVNKSYQIHDITTTILGGQIKDYSLGLRNYYSE